jgi:hypothetical protein
MTTRDDAQQVSLDEAIAIVREYGSTLFGKHARAFEVVLRAAARGRRLTSQTMVAAGSAVDGASVLERVRHEIAAGRAEVRAIDSRLAGVDAEVVRSLDRFSETTRTLRAASDVPPEPRED